MVAGEVFVGICGASKIGGMIGRVVDSGDGSIVHPVGWRGERADHGEGLEDGAVLDE